MLLEVIVHDGLNNEVIVHDGLDSAAPACSDDDEVLDCLFW